MKIHTRTLVIIGATLLILIITILFIAQFFILSSYARIEQSESFTNVDRVTSQIEFEKEKLGEITRDWSKWDDTYYFMVDKNPDYLTNNLDNTAPFESLQVNGFLYFNNSGDYVEGRWYDPQKKEIIGIPQGILDYLSVRPELLKNLTDENGIQGFIQQPEGLYMVSMHSILKSSGEGPSLGTLIIVIYYDDTRVTALQNRVHIPVKMLLLNEQWLSTDPIVIQLTAPDAPNIVSRVHDVSTLLSNTLIYDIEKKPVMLLKVTTQRSVYEQGIETFSFFIVSFLIIAFIFGAVTELLLRRYIVNPLANLDLTTKNIGEKRDLSVRLPVSGDDEIASLKRSLNAMLQRLEDSQFVLTQQGEELAEANRKANLYLDIYLDVLTYEIMNSIFSLSGYAVILKNSVGEREKEYTLRMIEIINKSENVIRNIETISNIYKHPPEQKPVNLDKIVAKEISSNKGINIISRNCDELVLADEMLQVAFRNLISNSIKSGGPAVKIEISAEYQPDGMILISLSDTGTGIPDEMKSTIFDRFLKGSDKRSSYGLGLHIVKMLIEAYGGRIWALDRIEGHPEEGTVIRFTLKKG